MILTSIPILWNPATTNALNREESRVLGCKEQNHATCSFAKCGSTSSSVVLPALVKANNNSTRHISTSARALLSFKYHSLLFLVTLMNAVEIEPTSLSSTWWSPIYVIATTHFHCLVMFHKVLTRHVLRICNPS